ncbi:MAG: glycosyltransferase family 1 protein [Bacteroidetes bacterium]|nr:MAG: glycosyltransferase family 1 protein [Bacteroidota bacterium]
MLISVNTRLLLKDKLEGIGWFSYESLRRITKSHPEHQFLFLFDRPFSEEFIFSDNISPIVIGPQARHPLLWYWWFEQSLPKVLHKQDPDLFLSPDGFLPLSYSSPAGVKKCKFLPVIHDLNFEHYPQDIPFLARIYFKKYFPKYAKKATRIATVSGYSKKDISKAYSISSDKIDVVYDGANEMFKPKTQPILNPSQREGFVGVYPFPLGRVGDELYFLFVGALSPRKNVDRLLQAFDEFKKSSSSNVKLVIVGEKMFMTSEIENIFGKMKFKNDVLFTGRLKMNELSEVMASAIALVFVPYFEGFGIPIVEAMCCDVPVITSNVTSMPEVAGDAALLVDPFSIDSIKEGMLKIYNDESLRNQLIVNGRIQRQKFSWDKTAEKLWGSIEKTIL